MAEPPTTSTAAVETDITVQCSSEYPDYSYSQAHDIWTLVSLKAPTQEEDDEDKRAPIDVVAVLDKSGSMAGEKLNLVKKTMEFVLTQLNEKDQLSMITYDSDVYRNFGFMKMTKENKDTALQRIKNVHDGSSTNLCGGLMKGLVQVIDRTPENKNDVASVLLFTDGLANQGITGADGIIAAMKDPKRFDGPSSSGGGGGGRMMQQRVQQPMMNRAAPPPQPPPVQKANKKMKKAPMKSKKAAPAPVVQQQAPPPPPPPVLEDEMEVEPPATDVGAGQPADATVYTFGFGDDHDPVLLKKISDAGNGMYYFIETEDKIGESFAHCLGGLMSTTAQGIQLQVTMEPGVQIKEVHSARPFEMTGADSVKVNIGDLQSEESRDIVLELQLGAVDEPYESTPQPVLKASVDYFNVVTNNLGNANGDLGVLRPASESAHDEASINPIVTKEKCRVGMTKAMKEADSMADSGNYEGVKQLLTSQVNKMKANRDIVAKHHGTLGLEEEYDAMAEDLEECRINSESSRVWKSKGKKMQMNKMQMYDNQRSSESTAKAFKSKKKAAAVGRSKAYFDQEEEEE